MVHIRHLHIVDRRPVKGLFMKVAFASTDKIHIDEHFGQAEQFYVWDVGPEEAAFTGVVQVSAAMEAGHSDDKIEARAAALGDCALVYVAEIGGPAAARLVAKKIHTLKSKEREPIVAVIEKLQEVLANNPPPWLRKAMMKGERISADAG
jgi:nitrogen fixation protein NifX